MLRATPRLVHILGVLGRHGFFGALRGRGHRPSPLQVRETFEELGLTFIKFGQILAMRRDLLPAAYLAELESLHDHLPPMDAGAARSRIEAELGAPMSTLFTSFDESPVAAATIGQVHAATLADGRRVAIKVQRTGLQETITSDVAALTQLVRLGERHFPSLRALDLPVVVVALANSLAREMDFGREAQSLTVLRVALEDVPGLWIPKVVAERSTGKVLTMEFSAGERIDRYAALHPESIPGLVQTLVRIMLQTIFEEGLFHADPHPGNVFVLPDGRLSLLDFGMTGYLDEQMRSSMVLLLEAVVKGDARAAKEAYLELAPTAHEGVNRAALLVDIKAVLYEFHGKDPRSVAVGAVLDALVRAGSRNGVRNPPEFFLLTRAFVILESMVRRLAPGHDYIQSFRDEILRLTTKQFSTAQVEGKTREFVRDMERLTREGPADLRRLLRRLAAGDLGRLQAPAVEALGGRVSRNLRRLSTALASTGLLVAGSVLVGLDGWHHQLGEAMVMAGLVGTILLVLGLLTRIRARR